MADNPNKKGADAKRISQQPHEQAYQKRKKREAAEHAAGRSSDGSEASKTLTGKGGGRGK